jgi:hypothetical protein
MIVYDIMIDLYNRYPTLWYGLPESTVFLLLIPLIAPFSWTLLQHLSRRYCRFKDRAIALEYAFSQIRPRSRLQRFFNRYFTAIFLLDLTLIIFALAHDTDINSLLTPERVLIWGIAWSFRIFIKHLKRSLQDSLREEQINWAKHRINDILAICSDFFVLSFISDHPQSQALFDKIFIFPEAKPSSFALEIFGPLCFDAFHLNGVALADDSSLFMFDGKDNIVIHTKETLRNLLKLDYQPKLAEKDEQLLEILSGLPYYLLKEKTRNTTWDCVRQVMGEESDSVEQYERAPFDDQSFETIMPYMRGLFTPGIPRVELFLEYVTKIISSPSSFEIFWHGNPRAPTWIPLYPRQEGELITDKIQHVIRKHRRAKLSDKSIACRLPSDESRASLVVPSTENAPEQKNTPNTENSFQKLEKINI